MQRSAVVFLGNALITRHEDLVLQHTEHGLAAATIEPAVLWDGDEPVINPLHRSAPVERMVEALLEADEKRFHEFHPTVARWQTQHGR